MKQDIKQELKSTSLFQDCSNWCSEFQRVVMQHSWKHGPVQVLVQNDQILLKLYYITNVYVVFFPLPIKYYFKWFAYNFLIAYLHFT